MPINSINTAYSETIAQWERVRDVRSGSDAVKAKGTHYLPSFKGQESGEYNSYKYRAMFLPVVARTVNTLVGLATYKRPELEAPSGLKDIAPTIGTEGQPLDLIVATLLQEVVSVGRVGALVDIGTDVGVTSGTAPSIAIYTAESITNWLTFNSGGKVLPGSIVLREQRAKPADDPYLNEMEDIYRELRFGIPPLEGESVEERRQYAADVFDLSDQDLSSGVYFQVVWVIPSDRDPKSSAKAQYAIESIVVPRRPGGGAFTSIPFVIFNAHGLGTSVGEVPMDDLATINLSHYLNSADLEHGRHFTALPTAWLAGFDMKSDLYIGSTKAWVTDNAQAKAGFLEFTGAGLGHLQQGMEQKERLMAVVGVRFLETNVGGPEKPEAVRLRQQGDRATLVAMMDVIEDGMNTLLGYVLQFMSASDPGDVKFSMPRDVTETRLDPQTLVALTSAVQAGLLSWESYVGTLASTGALPDGVDAEEEARRLLAGIPGGGLQIGGTPTKEPETVDPPEE